MAICSFLETLDHDWAIVSNTFVLCFDARAISQELEAKFRLVLGEWFLNLLEGVPYFQDVFIKNPSIPLIKSLFSNVVTSTAGVVSLIHSDFQFDPIERILYYSITCSTDVGQNLTVDGSFVMGDQ